MVSHPTLSKPITRNIDTPDGPLVVTLDSTGVSIRAPKHRSGITLSFPEIIAAALQKHPTLRWPSTIQDKPVEQLKRLARRQL